MKFAVNNIILTPLYLQLLTINYIWKPTSHLFAHYAYRFDRRYLIEKRFLDSYLMLFIDSRAKSFCTHSIPSISWRLLSYVNEKVTLPRLIFLTRPDPQQFLNGLCNHLVLSIKYICKQENFPQKWHADRVFMVCIFCFLYKEMPVKICRRIFNNTEDLKKEIKK